MIGKQLINGFIEYGIPYISSRKCCRKKQNQVTKQWKIDQRLNEFDWQMLVPEYLEMSKDPLMTISFRYYENVFF